MTNLSVHVQTVDLQPRHSHLTDGEHHLAPHTQTMLITEMTVLVCNYDGGSDDEGGDGGNWLLHIWTIGFHTPPPPTLPVCVCMCLSVCLCVTVLLWNYDGDSDDEGGDDGSWLLHIWTIWFQPPTFPVCVCVCVRVRACAWQCCYESMMVAVMMIVVMMVTDSPISKQLESTPHPLTTLPVCECTCVLCVCARARRRVSASFCVFCVECVGK